MENIKKCECCVTMTGLEFCNELIRRLNENVDRYVGECICQGCKYPENEYFNVDDVYEVIDRVLDGIPEDTEFK